MRFLALLVTCTFLAACGGGPHGVRVNGAAFTYSTSTYDMDCRDYTSDASNEIVTVCDTTLPPNARSAALANKASSQ